MGGWTDFFSHFDEGFLDEEFDLDFKESANQIFHAKNVENFTGQTEA